MIRLLAAESPRKPSSPQAPIFLALEDIPGTYLVWHETCLRGTEGGTTEEINKFCKLHLARYKVPKQSSSAASYRSPWSAGILRRVLRREGEGAGVCLGNGRRPKR